MASTSTPIDVPNATATPAPILTMQKLASWGCCRTVAEGLGLGLNPGANCDVINMMLSVNPHN